MIPLTLRASFEDPDGDPFVTRLSTNAANEGARLVGELPGRTVFAAPENRFEIFELGAGALLGDIVFATPRSGLVQRWIRAGSTHNTLLVTERCDQLCVMCSQPPKKTHVDLFEHLAAACRLAPENAAIGISGGEPTLFKDQLFAFLEAITRDRSDISFHVLTNAQHFENGDISILRRLSDQRIEWGVPLYAADAETHDEIVVKSGAFDQLLGSLAILARAGVQIELRTVLLRRNFAALPRLAAMIASRLPFVSIWAIMQLERIGFAKSRWRELFVDHSANPGPLLSAVSIAAARNIAVALYNVPYCTVPNSLRPLLSKSISDWKQSYALECTSCAAKDACCGFFSWHANLNEYRIGGAIS